MMENPNLRLKRVVASSLQRKIETVHALSAKRCIYRVPENLRKVNEAAYRPTFVSIGPFHFSDIRLQSMQGQKLKYLNSFLSRGSNEDNGYQSLLENYISLIEANEEEVRECYAEKIWLCREEFVEMVLLDAVFVIEFLVRRFRKELRDQDCVLFNQPSIRNQVRRDLLLEENQLPFFILKLLYSKAFPMVPPTSRHRLSFLGICCRFISSKPNSQRLNTEELDTKLRRVEATFSEIKHFVDLCRVWFLPSEPHKPYSTISTHIDNNRKQATRTTKSVKELRAAGVKFKVSNRGNLLDISFANGVLHIPKLKVSDATESMLRNMVAFEQCHYSHTSSYYLIDYLIFLDDLIDTVADVEILVGCGIIENYLGSYKEVANLVNAITSQTISRRATSYLGDVVTNLNAYAAIPCNRWKVILRREYFNHPWSIISFIYALLTTRGNGFSDRKIRSLKKARRSQQGLTDRSWSLNDGS